MTITDYLRQIRENAWSSRQLGTEFERFLKRYLKVEPSYASQFSDVWLWSECPFAKGSDVGIDLVAKTNFGEYVAIQAKCYQPGTQVDKADVDTFLSASGKQIAPDGKPTYYAARIIIATNDNWTNHASEAIVDQQIPVTRIGLAQIQNSAIDWERFFAGAKKSIVKKSVRPHQEAAIKDVVKGFAKRERGQLIMACGTGKTFTSLKIAESICPENGLVLFLVPSISLLGQSLREWCEQAEKPITPFAVCSDSKVTKDPDDTSFADLGFPATTSAAQLARYMRTLGGSRSRATADAQERVPPAAHPSATPPYWWKSGKWGVASPMPEGGHVVMGLKHKWYEKIEAGLKHEEQREVKPFWDAKLSGRKGKELRAVTFMKGQASKEQMTWEVLRVDLRGNYYCLELGKRIA